jgi:hypothetical protein
MPLYLVQNSASGLTLGYFAAQTADEAIGALLADASCEAPPSPHLRADLADADVILDAADADRLGFDLAQGGTVGAALYLRARANGGHASLEAIYDEHADLYRGEIWHAIDLTQDEAARDVALILNR